MWLSLNSVGVQGGSRRKAENVDVEGEMAYSWQKGREPGGARTSPQDGSTAIDGNYESSNP